MCGLCPLSHLLSSSFPSTVPASTTVYERSRHLSSHPHLFELIIFLNACEIQLKTKTQAEEWALLWHGWVLFLFLCLVTPQLLTLPQAWPKVCHVSCISHWFSSLTVRTGDRTPRSWQVTGIQIIDWCFHFFSNTAINTMNIGTFSTIRNMERECEWRLLVVRLEEQSFFHCRVCFENWCLGLRNHSATHCILFVSAFTYQCHSELRHNPSCHVLLQLEPSNWSCGKSYLEEGVRDWQLLNKQHVRTRKKEKCRLSRASSSPNTHQSFSSHTSLCPEYIWRFGPLWHTPALLHWALANFQHLNPCSCLAIPLNTREHKK